MSQQNLVQLFGQILEPIVAHESKSLQIPALDQLYSWFRPGLALNKKIGFILHKQISSFLAALSFRWC